MLWSMCEIRANVEGRHRLIISVTNNPQHAGDLEQPYSVSWLHASYASCVTTQRDNIVIWSDLILNSDH